MRPHQALSQHPSEGLKPLKNPANQLNPAYIELFRGSLADFVRAEIDPDKVQEKLDITTEGVVHIRAVQVVGTDETSGTGGTGFIFHIDGNTAYILTAAHVVGVDIIKYQVYRDQNRIYEAELVYKSGSAPVGSGFPRSPIDIASLKIECDDCKALALTNSSLLQQKDSWFKVIPNQEVVTISYRDLDQGIEIVRGSTLEDQTVFSLPGTILHDSYLLEGDSGSPLLNSEGYVLGINYARDDAGRAHALYLVDEHANRTIHNTLRRAREDRRR